MRPVKVHFKNPSPRPLPEAERGRRRAFPPLRSEGGRGEGFLTEALSSTDDDFEGPPWR